MADTILEMVRRHVAKGERIIAEQEALIERLRKQGLDTSEAERALESYRGILEQMRAHLAHAESINRPPSGP